MGTIIFDGEPPYELVVQRLPGANVDGEAVILTFPIALPGFPAQVADIRMRLMVEHAEQLLAQLQNIVQEAQVRKGW